MVTKMGLRLFPGPHTHTAFLDEIFSKIFVKQANTADATACAHIGPLDGTSAQKAS